MTHRDVLRRRYKKLNQRTLPDTSWAILLLVACCLLGGYLGTLIHLGFF